MTLLRYSIFFSTNMKSILLYCILIIQTSTCFFYQNYYIILIYFIILVLLFSWVIIFKRIHRKNIYLISFISRSLFSILLRTHFHLTHWRENPILIMQPFNFFQKRIQTKLQNLNSTILKYILRDNFIKLEKANLIFKFFFIIFSRNKSRKFHLLPLRKKHIIFFN